MTKWNVTLALLVCVLLANMSLAEDRTLAEFRDYVAGKVPNFTPAQLDTMAKGVDRNGDGTISSAEFEKRMEIFQAVVSEKPLPKNAKTLPTQKPPNATSNAHRHNGNATVLLITAEELKAAWQPFAHWKTRNGKATKIITVVEIAKKYKAASIQEKIRLCVRDHIDQHSTRWVVLGGDSLPGGKGLVPGGHITVHQQEPRGIPTDIVYLSKTNWDADDDGVYGEWKDDRKAITYPDGSVGLGRIPVRTAADVAAFTDKVISYESKYPTTTFAQQMVYTCTVGPAYPKVRNSWDGYLSKAWTGGKVGRYFSAETPWDKDGKPGSHALSPKNVIAMLNDHAAGKLHIHGHGHLPAWVLEDGSFTGKHVAQLKNAGAYPLITTVCCNTGEYDSANDPSIVEQMIRQPKAGSVAVVAPVRTGKPHFHSRADFVLMVRDGKLDGTTQTMTRYWVNGLGNGSTTGESLMKAKSDMTADAKKTPGYHLCICELNLLGDPTLDMRAKPPTTPMLTVPSTVGTGEQVVEVSTGAAGCTVCLWKGAEIYQVIKSDGDGAATFRVAPKTSGDILVTASGASLNSATATIRVTSK